MKKDPPTIEPAPRPGPDYDPMDEIVEDLQNIQSFLDHLNDHPTDLHYLDTHLPNILAIRRTIKEHIDMLSGEPYDYPEKRLDLLKKENEQIFLYIEGAAGALNPPDPKEFKKFYLALGKMISQFDNHITP